jgi:hypothetical protein
MSHGAQRVTARYPLVHVAFILIRHTARGVNASRVSVPVGRVELVYSVGVRKIKRVRLVNGGWIDGVSDLGKIVRGSSGGVARFELLDVLGVPATRSSHTPARASSYPQQAAVNKTRGDTRRKTEPGVPRQGRHGGSFRTIANI